MSHTDVVSPRHAPAAQAEQGTPSVPPGRCQGRNRAGQPCGMTPLQGAAWCFAHSPDRAAERAVARRVGGLNRRTPKGQPGTVRLRSVADVQTELETAYADLLVQENSHQRARTAASLLTLAIKCLEVGELEERLAAIEARLTGTTTPTTTAPFRRAG